MRILIIDRDRSFTQGLSFFFKNKGFQIDSAYFGEDGIELAKVYDYDSIITELVLPDVSGLDVLKRLRANNITTPILFLSSVAQVSKKLECFAAGADDYVVKPGDRNELFARILALIRRSRGYSQSAIRVGEMEVNLETKIVTVSGKTLHLTGKEYALIELLCLRRGMTVTKEQFLNHLYGGMDEPEMKIIDVFLCRIRNKIAKLSGGNQYIQTAWGRGYILQEDKTIPKK